MQTILWVALLVVGTLVLFYRRTPLLIGTAIIGLGLAVVSVVSGGTSLALWIPFVVVAVVLNVKPIRQSLLSRRLLVWFRSMLPPMSQTEKDAIDAGTTWWDGQIFSGQPDWDELMRAPKHELSGEEQAFLDGPVEELCGMLNDWEINHELNDLPEKVWRFLKDNRFFGIIIPKQYGGLEFSPSAQSEVMIKIATRSTPAAITVMVPNSLGPGELLMHYGTDEQKDYYLPRLARGEEIPAFALTSPHAGSDAGGMPDVGVVCRAQFQGKDTLGFRINWEKRYITLGPVCTVLGLAFKATDPDGLLGDDLDLGITCALVPANTEGVTIGARHFPGGAFQNGPNSGKDVFVPMEWIIGGQSQVGNGWKMLMNCLSVGRAISLPALGTAAGKLTSLTTGAYARIRKQFNMSIGKFEGIEEALARIGGITYRMDSSRRLTASALNQGEKPSVLSAILKYHNTEGMRQVVNDALDIHGGRGVCDGPRNYLLTAYRMVPVVITVEGANILTRSMIIFGQGAIRCHPFVLDEMQAAANPDTQAGLEQFDNVLYKHIGLTISNAVRSFVLGLCGARLAPAPEVQSLRRYYQHVSRMSAAFAFIADIAMLLLGGELKRKERLSARFGDVLSHLYMASAVLKRFEDDGAVDADRPLAEWALQDSLYTAQSRMVSILENFPQRWLGKVLRRIVFPLGLRYRAPDDCLDHAVASLLQAPSATRDRLTDGAFIPRDSGDSIANLETLLEQQNDIEKLERQVAKHKTADFSPSQHGEVIRAALQDGSINEIDAQRLRDYWQLLSKAIAVDAVQPLKQQEAASVTPAVT